MTVRSLSRSSAARPARQTGIFERLARVPGIWRERHDLARLDPHLRKDLGLSQTDIDRELARSMWDVPDFWRR